MKKLYLWRSLVLGALLSALSPLALAAQVNITGMFINWNVNPSLEIPQSSPGIYAVDIDFSSGNSFKLSTQTDATSWSDFDKGTLYYSGTPQLGQWVQLASEPKSGNCKAPGTGRYRVTVDLTASRICFTDAQLPSTAWSGTLPLLHINTASGAPITSKETYLDATYYLESLGAEGVADIGSAEAPLTMQIRGRSNYSWSRFDKKPYRLKLKEKQPLLGMNSKRHWALLAHADDNKGFMRNFAGFTASELLGMPWTPASQPCEVVLNGDYIGLYFLTETIRVDKKRVNIVEQDDLATTDVDGGWLVEIDNYSSDPHVTVSENGNSSHPIWFTYKSPEELSAQQSGYLLNQMQQIDNAVYSADKAAGSALESLVDFDILARYYITQELLDDCESFHGSCYLNRNRGEECKWLFGPVWDFGNALSRSGEQKFVWQDPPFRQVWIGEIYKFPAFLDAVKAVWKPFLYYNAGRLTSAMDNFASRIATAAACDACRWPKYGNPDELYREQQARDYIKARIKWLTSQWGDASGVESVAVLPADDYTVSISGRTLTFTATRPMTLPLSTPDGRCRLLQLTPDAPTVVPDLAPGLYILPSRKLLLK